MSLSTRTSPSGFAGLMLLFYIAAGIAAMLSTLAPGGSLRGGQQPSVFSAEQLRG